MKPLLPQKWALGLLMILVLSTIFYPMVSNYLAVLAVIVCFSMGALWHAGWMVKKTDDQKNQGRSTPEEKGEKLEER